MKNNICVFDEELLTAANSNNTADRLRAASVVMKECGDEEISGAFRVLSAMMDFDDNTEATDAIDRARERLDALIAERKDRWSSAYIGCMTDEEVLAFSGGEVKAGDYSFVESKYCKSGLFDPDIFGGSGEIVVHKGGEKGSICADGFGTNFGHIALPIHVLPSSDYNMVARLLHMTMRDVERVAKGVAYVVLEAGSSDYKTGTVVSESEMEEYTRYDDLVLGYGTEALYKLVKGLGYMDKPERLLFQNLPVIPPQFRPMAYCEETGKYLVHPLNDAYESVVLYSNRYAKLQKMGAPDVIMRNEGRMLNEKVDILMKKLRDSMDYVFTIYRNRAKSGNKDGFLPNPKPYLIALRKRQLLYHFSDMKKTKDISSLNIYPEYVLVEKDGETRRTHFPTLMDECHDLQDKFMDGQPIIYGEEDEWSEDEKKHIAFVDERIAFMDKSVDDILLGAKEHREKYVVKYDEDLDFYVPGDIVITH